MGCSISCYAELSLVLYNIVEFLDFLLIFFIFNVKSFLLPLKPLLRILCLSKTLLQYCLIVLEILKWVF